MKRKLTITVILFFVSFSALPAGSRWAKFHENKIYTHLTESGHYWTASEAVEDNTCARRCLITQFPGLQIGWALKNIG
jgi:hypothetical protein